jgi:AcrR family transcriptional regulator
MTAAGRRVLDAAAELFYGQGINAVGVATVAENAGVTKKTLYDCFGSKADLVVAYLRERHATWWEHLERKLADSPSVLVLFDAYLDHPALDVSRGCAFLNAAAELPAGHPGLDVIRAHKEAVRDRLAELVAAEAPYADREELAEHLFLLLEGAIAHARLAGDQHHAGTARAAAGTMLRPA